MQSAGADFVMCHSCILGRTGRAVAAGLFLALLLFLPFSSQAGPVPASGYPFFHVTIEDGLSQSTVRDVIEDRRGFLWFGTQGGLDRYDGTTFKRYRYNPADPNSISDNSIRSLVEDENGIIWIGTNGGGVNRLDPETNEIRRYRHDPSHPDTTLHDNYIMVVWVSPNGRVYSGSRYGVSRYEPQLDQFRSLSIFGDRPGIYSGSVFIGDLATDGNGGVWVGSYEGLYHWEEDDTLAEFTVLPTVGQLYPGRLAVRRLLYEEETGDLWVASESQGLFHRSPNGEWERFTHDPSNPTSLVHNNVWDIHRDKEGRLWVATNDGLSVLEPGTSRFVTLKHNNSDPTSLIFNEVHCIGADRDGTLWFGTFGGGLSAYNPKRYRFGLYNSNPNISPRLSYSHIMAVVTDSKGGLWVGSDGGGVDYIPADGSPVKRYKAADKKGPPGDRVWSLFVDSRDRIWMGTFGSGLSRINADGSGRRVWRVNYDDPHTLVNNYVADIMEDDEGRIWFATLGGEVCHYDEEQDHFIVYQRGLDESGVLTSPTTRTIMQDRAGRIWYGTNDGLHLLDPESGEVRTWSHIPGDPTSLGHNVVLTIHEDSQGRFWVGTRSGGLSLMDRKTGTFTRYSVADGLPDDMIYGILEDDLGNLWMSTNNGLCRFDPTSGEISVYHDKDGLQADEFNQGAYHKGADGLLYFGGVGGITWFDPENLINGTHSHPVVISQFQVMNQPWTMEREPWALETVELPWDHNMVSFEFTALNYLDPHRMYYRYKLEGVDEVWVDADSRRYAAYTNLPPGDYTFRVQAGEVRGGEQMTEASLGVVIIPPFWRTAWFIVLASMALFGTVGGLISWRLYSMHLYNQRLEADVADRTQLLATSNQKLLDKRRELEKVTDRQKNLLAERQQLIGELQQALGEVKTLSGLIPICASCKKVRDDSGYWNQVEDYIAKHSKATFTHGICPDCKEKALKDLHEKIERENGEIPPPQVY